MGLCSVYRGTPAIKACSIPVLLAEQENKGALYVTETQGSSQGLFHNLSWCRRYFVGEMSEGAMKHCVGLKGEPSN